MSSYQILDAIAALPESHIVRTWWEGRLVSPGNGSWPQRPDQAVLDAMRSGVGGNPRGALVESCIRQQYQTSGIEPPQRLSLLATPDCRTVTTGHQLCLAGGPAFTYYKIRTAIALAARLEKRWGTPVLPVFWMASEDHDFDEVSGLWSGEEWVRWNPSGPVGGPVGRMSTDGVASLLKGWLDGMGSSEGWDSLIRESGNGATLAQAMRHWIHALFPNGDVVVIDGDVPELKSPFVSVMRKEVEEALVHRAVSEVDQTLSSMGFAPQVHVRECNLFHMDDLGRHRLAAENGGWSALGGKKWASKTDLLAALESDPHSFSPNALLRPVYQNFLLPDVAMVGGMAEIAYWIQLTGVYERLGMTQPALVPRDGAWVLPQRWSRLLEKTHLGSNDLGRPWTEWESEAIAASGPPNVKAWRQSVDESADQSLEIFSKLDASLAASVQAARARIHGVLDKLEQQGRKAIKRKETEALARLSRIHGWVQPMGVNQERITSFIQLSVEWDRAENAPLTLSESLSRSMLEGHGEGDWRPLVHLLRQD